MAPRCGRRLIQHPFAIEVMSLPKCYERKMALIAIAYLTYWQSFPKTAENGHFGHKFATKWAQQLEIKQNLSLVMRICSRFKLS